MSQTVSGSYAQISTSRPARLATTASAVPHAPAPTMPTVWSAMLSPCLAEWARRSMPTGIFRSRHGHRQGPRPAMRSSLDARADGRRGVGIERPARPRRRRKRVGKPARKPHGPRPGDHRGVVGAELGRRHDEAEDVLPRGRFERGLEALIGRHPAGDDEDALGAVPGVPLVKRKRAGNSVAQDLGHRLLEARAEIGHVLFAQRRAGKCYVPERGLEPGEREMRLFASYHWPWKLDFGTPLGGEALDLRSAGIAEPQQLRRLVEGLAERVVERRSEPLVDAHVL